MSRRAIKDLTIDEVNAMATRYELTPAELATYTNIHKYATLRLNSKAQARECYKRVYPDANNNSASVGARKLDSSRLVKSIMARTAANACKAAQVNANLLIAKALELVNFNPKNLRKNGKFVDFEDLTDEQAAAITKLDYVTNQDGDLVTKLGWVPRDKALAQLKDIYQLWIDEKRTEADREAILGTEVPDNYKDKAALIVSKHMSGEISQAAAKSMLSIIKAGVDVENADLKDLIEDLQDRIKDLI